MNMTREERLNFWDRYFRGAYVKRLDICGAVMERDAQENTNASWEVDHIFPEAKLQLIGVAQEKIDHPLNLQPLNASNNSAKGDDYPIFNVCVTSNGVRNWAINDKTHVIDKIKIKQLNNLYGSEMITFMRACINKSNISDEEKDAFKSIIDAVIIANME